MSHRSATSLTRARKLPAMYDVILVGAIAYAFTSNLNIALLSGAVYTVITRLIF